MMGQEWQEARQKLRMRRVMLVMFIRIAEMRCRAVMNHKEGHLSDAMPYET